MGADVTEIVEAVKSGDSTADVEAIADHDLPPEVTELVEEYERFDGTRDPFLWKWFHWLTPQFTFSFVPDEHVADARTAKMLAGVFITIVDDFLEKDHDRETFDEAVKIPHAVYEMDADREGVQTRQLELVRDVWTTLLDVLERAPSSEEYLPLLRFDTEQATNAVHYSYLLDSYPELANTRELTVHESHNIMMFAYADVDLMFGPTFPRSDLATLRQMVWQAQMMARIGNWIATWERELHETDFSSGPVVHALESGLLDYEDLDRLRTDQEFREAVIEDLREAGVEAVFFEQWQSHYEELERLAANLSTIDATSYAEGMETVLQYFLRAKGKI
ncbi:hypothetical protein M0R88_03345 [Halorussus gelatinilyticus]|uniref:Uncharacterized protein n=1 Tax=Halorussus gelatinilyticus TaxID=2937524 RepID=A0A8U0IKF5_9EURY|nr:hypothetical protein [Halorussus gelatinilyticus]UPW01145.1 hypothetical protein M0R88_03345 [Halorussus gelatinilyticus]